MRRPALVLLCALAAIAVLAAPALAKPEATLTDTSDAGSFPWRTWILGLPETRTLEQEAVHVEEDGRAVLDLMVTPAGSGRGSTAGTVLVIDTSASMEGEPIRDAIAAAREFAARRKPQQKLGIVFFNGSHRVHLQPTSDAAAIDKALVKVPSLHGGTKINDAVGVGLETLRNAGIDTGSLVVLSDGDDTGSRVSSAQVIKAARRDHIRVFTVGLASRSFTPGALERLAASTGARAAVATSSGSLRRTFAALGTQLSSEYVVRYRSREPAGERVNVNLYIGRDAEPSAIAAYEAPEPSAAVPPGSLSKGQFWTTTEATVLVVFGFAFLGFIGFSVLVRPPARPGVGQRIASYAPVYVPASEGSGPGWLVTHFEQSVRQNTYWLRFVEAVEIAQLKQSATHLGLAGAGGLFVAFVSLVLGITALAILALLIPVGIVLFVRFSAAKVRRAFGEQLADNLQVFASALRAGHSFTGALGTVVEDAPDPTRSEFKRALADERLGVSIDEALSRTGQRMQSKEMNQVAMIAALQQETGGNTAEVLDRVIDNIRERQELRRLVRSLTAQGRISQMVVTVLPFAIAGLVTLINPGYLKPLFESSTGHIAIGACLVMIALGSLAIHKIIDIKV